MTHEILPLIPVPKLTDERMKELYDKLMKQPNKPIPRNIRNPEDYMFLEAKQHGSYSYPDLLVSMHRLGLTPEVQKAANKLGLIVSNTAKEQDGHLYIGNLQHEHAIKLVIESGFIPVNLRLFVDFLKEIKSGLNGKKVCDGNKNIIPYDKLLTTWNEITEVREPLRIEHLDNKFIRDGQLYTIYHQINTYEPPYLTSELLDGCLIETKQIDLEDWLERATNQGLPPNDIKPKKLQYFPFRNGSFAWFGTDSDLADLDCDRNSLDLDSALGVRVAKIKG